MRICHGPHTLTSFRAVAVAVRSNLQVSWCISLRMIPWGFFCTLPPGEPLGGFGGMVARRWQGCQQGPNRYPPYGGIEKIAQNFTVIFGTGPKRRKGHGAKKSAHSIALGGVTGGTAPGRHHEGRKRRRRRVCHGHERRGWHGGAMHGWPLWRAAWPGPSYGSARTPGGRAKGTGGGPEMPWVQSAPAFF